MTPPTPSGAAPEVLERAARVVGPAVQAAVGRLSPALLEPLAHHLAGAGKGVRGALVLVAAAAAGAEQTAGLGQAVGLPGAVAVELVHNYSLIHDDIMDEDLERRHRPTVWAQFGIGAAIIAGDALAALATEVLLDDPTPPRVAAAAALTRATQEMIAGQADDLAYETRDAISVEECQLMEARKTGALLACSAALGPILAGAPTATVSALADFGQHLGAAFQAVDDILGIWGLPARTGKAVGNDLEQHKKSLPVVVALARAGDRRAALAGLLDGELGPAEVAAATRMIEECGAEAETRALADHHFGAALAALDRADLVAGPRADLVAIANFVTERDR
jgi:geranylgeranyl diphosphate synthase type I